MRITVFGADGFLGRDLVLALAKSKYTSITAFSRFSSLLREDTKSHPFSALKNVALTPGDFYNRDEVEDAVKGADYVFQLVTSTTPASSTKDPLVDIDTNLRGTVELLNLCSDHKVKKVIFFSSGGAVYGDVNSSNIKENEPLAPVSPYGISKVAIEHYLEYFYKTRGLDYITYRIANPYGPGQKIKGKQGVIPIFMHHFLEKEPLTIYGNGEMIRDYIYVDDLINMVCKTFHRSTKYKTYNIGSGTGTSVNTLVSVLEKNSDHTPKKEFLDAPATFVKQNVLNIDRFIQEFNIIPQISLEEGIERTWNYVRQVS